MLLTAEAFKKLIYRILGDKVAKQKIYCKQGGWIKDFLTNKKENKVAANGILCEEEDVLSGVPKGTALAPVLLIIMIDEEREVKESIVR